MAVWNRQRAGDDVSGLVHHSDRGVQYLSIRYADRLAANDIVASVGSKGDSYDNALAESFNGLYKWELIYRQGPWRGLDDVEFATMTYVDWFNHRRLHGTITAGRRLHDPGRPRSRLLPSDHPGPRAGHPITRAVTEPGALQVIANIRFTNRVEPGCVGLGSSPRPGSMVR